MWVPVQPERVHSAGAVGHVKGCQALTADETQFCAAWIETSSSKSSYFSGGEREKANWGPGIQVQQKLFSYRNFYSKYTYRNNINTTDATFFDKSSF